MKKNSRLSRILTAFLALVLLLSAFAISALAQDTGKSVNAEIDTVYEGRGGIVTLTFDDGRTDTSTLVNELMKEYELTGTLMLIGKNVEKNMSLWNEIFQDGKLIPQNHSMNHIGMRPSMDTEVENITEENFQAEIVDSKVFFENIFPDYDMITYAIPNGSWADGAAEVAVGEYYMIRSSYGGLQSLNPGYLLNKNGNWSSIKCISIDTTKRPEQLTELKSQVDQATQGQWMCTLTHRVGDIDNTELTESEARELFAYISAYEKSGLLWVTDTVSATKYIRERQNTTVSATKSGKVITLSSAMAAKTEDGLTLDKNIFNHPLTVKVELDSSFENAFYTVGGAHKEAEVFTEGSKRYARVEIIPGGEDVVIYPLNENETTILNAKLQEASGVLDKAMSRLDAEQYTALASLISDGYELIRNYENEAELDAMVKALDEECAKILELLATINTFSKGAKKTIFDTAENVKVIHLNSNGIYTMSSPGAGKTFTLYQTVDGVQTEVASWTEGSAYARVSDKNPCVAFILDENVTFSGTSSWYATNVMFDLNGNDIRFTSASSAPINLKNGAHVEFRGTGNIVWATTGYYMVQGDNFNGVVTLNGNVTVDTEDPNAKVIFYLKGGIYVYGTLTINDNFNATAAKGAVFFTQGTRADAKDVKGFIEIADATVNANNHGGAALLYAKGVSGEYGGATYASIPEINITNSTLNLRCPLANELWGSDAVGDAYASTKDQPLENAVNTTVLNIINSRINASIYYENSFTDAIVVSLISPKGYTTVNVEDSVITMTHGRIFLGRGGVDFNVNCNNSVLTTNFSDAEASAISSEMSKSTILRGTTLVMTKSAKGSATFTNCTITTAYRMFEGANTDASVEAFFITATNCEMRHTAKSSVFAVRANVTVNGGIIDCGTGNLTYRTLPYNPDTKTGVLFTGGVILYNAPSSAYSATNSTYAITVSAYAEKAKNDSAVYTTYGASHVVTIADGTKFTQINSKLTASGRYSFRLDVIGAENDTGLDPLCNVTLYTDFVIHVYVPVSETLTEIELDGVKYTDFDSLDIRIHEGTSYYKISKRVPLTYAAEKMSLKVTVTAEGEQITEAWTLSVVTHVKSLINSDDMSDATKTLAKDVLSYIRAAYEYASVCEADIERINAIIGTNYDSTSMPDTTISASESFPAINAATLELGSRPSFVFWVKEDYDATSFKFSVNGNNLDYEIFTDDDGNTCIRLSMYAFLMADTVTYTVDGADVQGEYNIKTYYEFAKKLNDDSLTNLVERLWKYAESARIYEKEVR